MIGIISILKPALLYKCQSCGHKFNLLSSFLSKKCPLCGGGQVKVIVGMTENTCNPLDKRILQG